MLYLEVSRQLAAKAMACQPKDLLSGTGVSERDDYAELDMNRPRRRSSPLKQSGNRVATNKRKRGK